MLIRIYTDGSCSDNPGPGGWAAVINDDSNCIFKAGNELQTTNNRMELTAVVESINIVLNEHDMSEKNTYELYSDSAYVINGITKQWIEKWENNQWKTSKGDDVKNKDLWETLSEQLRELKRRKIQFNFIKIKGHVGNTFNEMVDRLAKQQTTFAKLEAK